VLSGEIAAGDIVVCLGAGDITRWAAELAPAIAAKRGAAE
jgi:UDP-N-acetylmuramate--alanine ligase